MSSWHEQVSIEGSVRLPPEARALEGLGRNHSLQTALADLVDNAIDAHASEILIRFVRQVGRLRALYVVDNGHGMGAQEIDTAMTVGGSRHYGRSELGRFGVGLKAASFSQARAVTVMSRTLGSPPVGRRWVLGADRDFRCDIVSDDFCADEFDRDWGLADSGAGTIVRWDDVSGLPATDDPARVERFLTHTMTTCRNHLGLVLHRILEKGQATISLDVEDVDRPHPGPRLTVRPLNPFAYTRSGDPGYPKQLVAATGDHKVIFACHIWPGRSRIHEFRLSSDPTDNQGLYIYRNDRLLHAGGDWGGLHSLDRSLQLARVAIDIDDALDSGGLGLFQMNPEKSKVLTGPDFPALAEQAQTEDGTTFANYLTTAEQNYRTSRKRTRSRKAMIPPGKGFPPSLRATLQEEIPPAGHDRLNIRWRSFNGDTDFFRVDRDNDTLWLNQLYRPEPPSGRLRHSVNDAPVLKALLYLLIEDVFEGEFLGAKDRDNIELWQEVLTAAAKSKVDPE
jgi:hypothetical protein